MIHMLHATPSHMDDLLKAVKKEQQRFKRLPAAERRRIASEHLQRIGILDRRGRLKPGLR